MNDKEKLVEAIMKAGGYEAEFIAKTLKEFENFTESGGTNDPILDSMLMHIYCADRHTHLYTCIDEDIRRLKAALIIIDSHPFNP